LNLASIVFESARKHNAELAVSGGVTYQQLAGAVAHFARYLIEKGFSPGKRVALVSENRPEFTVAYFAILSVGAVVVPINTVLSVREVTYCLDHAEVFGVIFSEPVRVLVEESVACLNHDPLMVCLDNAAKTFEYCDLGGHEREFEPFPTRPDDTAVVFYTSGTTGRPKGAQVTHHNLHSNARWVSERSLRDKTSCESWGPGHCSLAALPLSHSFGQTCMQNAPLVSGGCVSYMPKFDAADLAAQIITDRVTILAAVPRMVKSLLELPRVRPGSFVHFQYCLVGGAPIDQEVAREFEDVFGVAVLEGYGLSETSPVVAFRTPDIPRKKGSVGRAIDGVDICVVDQERQRVIPGEIGEVVVKGHAVMKGYLHDARATHETIRDGWLHTGDVGYLDAEGDLFLLDRQNDIIIRNGYNVYPAEVETVLLLFSGVMEAAVIGIEDAQCGQEVKAFVVGEFDTQALKAFCRSQLAAYKYPRIIERVLALPKGNKGQILRRVLKDSK
jgi:long-chain acyl-CoA synthetase